MADYNARNIAIGKKKQAIKELWVFNHAQSASSILCIVIELMIRVMKCHEVPSRHNTYKYMPYGAKQK